jgi:2-polyprenyl-3-methyl-5-hydroxy-6-metoxy-1,4-benzoquinol methylase
MRGEKWFEQLESIFHMNRETIESEFAPYFYEYYRRIFKCPVLLGWYFQGYQHIFDVTQSRIRRVLDIGCGFGLISIYFAASGAKMVSAVDNNQEKIRVLQTILSRFNPALDNIEAKLGDAPDLSVPDNYFDVIIANEVISHVVDADLFIREMTRVLHPGGTLYIRDSNNSLDIRGRYQRRKLWGSLEQGTGDNGVLQPEDQPLPWRLARRRQIQERFPQLDAVTLDLLARETAGLYGDSISAAVEGYLKTGQMPNKPDFKFRDPETGAVTEFEFNPYGLKKKLEKSDYSVKILKPYYPRRPLLSGREFLNNLVIYGVRMLHPLSTAIAPRFEILARKNGH